MPGFIRSKITFLAAAIVLAAAGSTASAQEILTLEKAIDVALTNNRSTQNARLETEKTTRSCSCDPHTSLSGFQTERRRIKTADHV